MDILRPHERSPEPRGFMDGTIKHIDVESLAQAGTSTTNARWVTNPLRRGLWFLVRPYFRALADEIDRALCVAASRHRIERGIEETAETASCAESQVKLFVPPGHYYSPVVDPANLPRTRNAANRLLPIPGIVCDIESMCATFSVLASLVADLDFPAERTEDYRYFFTNDMFWCGGALVLAGMIRKFRPRMIIEVGSGFSSAVILDTLDRTPELAGTRCMFIEPNQGRLQTMLRPSDRHRVDIVPHPVQQVPLSHFEQLQAGDILFLDTTHIVENRQRRCTRGIRDTAALEKRSSGAFP